MRQVIGLVVSVVALVEHKADDGEYTEPEGGDGADDSARLTGGEVGVASVVDNGGDGRHGSGTASLGVRLREHRGCVELRELSSSRVETWVRDVELTLEW